MTERNTGTRDEWLAARLELLEAEKDLTRRSDELARQRQELPWVRIDKAYRFDTDEGAASLTDLFRGRSQLLIYHFMFGPDYTAGCPSCSAIADGFNGFVTHLVNHDVTLSAVSGAPLARIQAYEQRMGWSFPWVSSLDSDFNADFGVWFTEDQQRGGDIEYNFQREPALEWRPGQVGGGEQGEAQVAAMCGTDTATYRRDRPGMSAFVLEDGVVYHTYSTYARGLDGLWGMYQWLDRAPRGRNETGIWWRRHDEYGNHGRQPNTATEITSAAPGPLGPTRRRTLHREIMNDAAATTPTPEATDSPALPKVVDLATFQAELDALRVREKAHTREGDGIAAARRRLPMVEMDPDLELLGPAGPVTLLDAFEGRRQLIAYYFMWNPGRPATEQCEGCTVYTSQVTEVSYLHSRDVTYAVFCQGRNVAVAGAEPQVSYDESLRYRDFMGWDMPWYSAQPSLDALLVGREVGLFHLVCYLRYGDRVFETYWTNGRGVEAMDYSWALLDMTIYGRQEAWQDSPEGWPIGWDINEDHYRTNGRPIAQWSRLEAGRSDDLGTAETATATGPCHCH